MQVSQTALAQRSVSTHREWLETDGLGGYAGMTIGGSLARRYHGLLCVPISEFGERHVLISKLMPSLTLSDGQTFELDCNVFAGSNERVVSPNGDQLLERFWIDEAPRWEYRCGPALLQISILMPRGVSATLIEYRLYGAPRATLTLKPLLAAREVHKLSKENSAINQFPAWNEAANTLTFKPYLKYPGFQIVVPSSTRWQNAPQWWKDFYLARDAERGFDAREDLHCVGSFNLELREDESRVVSLLAPGTKLVTTPEILFVAEVSRRQERYGNGEINPILRRAAEQFLVTDPQGNVGVIAGYPWFERWGRDTLISVHGLTRLLGDSRAERAVLEHQLSLVQDGLIPNLITANGTALYNSIDAVLMLFVAVYRHFKRTTDNHWVQRVALPVLRDIATTLQKGTNYDIFVAGDALLSAGSGDVQLTWMDAKINGYPVTPRHGKAVEINALWFNAMKILGDLEESSAAALNANALATAIQRSFTNSFTRADGSLRDTLEAGQNATGCEIRPNQIFACSLPFAVIELQQMAPILDRIRADLLTPRGLRTLSQHSPAYRPRYEGDPYSRDTAYHQGTVWPWLFGPYGEALTRAGQIDELAHIKQAMTEMLSEGCIGSIAEVYDAESPQNPGGCFAQAWSVAAAGSIFA